MLNCKKNPLITGTLLLSASGLLCRGMGFFYRLFVSRSFGEEAMGVFQLTAPVVMLSFALSSSGFQTAISRFTASSLAQKDEYLARKFLKTGIFFSLSVSLCFSLIIFSMADIISSSILHEKRCEPLLKLISFSLPFASLHSCFNGYFYGRKETKLPSFCQVAEQFIRIGSIMFLYFFLTSKGRQPNILICCIGNLFSEIISCCITFLFYIMKYRNKKNIGLSKSSYSKASYCNQRNNFSDNLHSSLLPDEDPNKKTVSSILCYAMPLTFTRVVINLLSSLEAISLPKALRLFGYSASASLSIYGVFTGMAMSLVMFPSTFTNSASVLLLPTVSEAASVNNRQKIQYTLKRTLAFSILLGLSFSLLFYVGGDLWGKLLFDSDLAGILISQISFICPFLYLHTTLSSIMNGLKKTMETFLINICSLVLRLMIVIFSVPHFGISAYIWGILFSEILSACLCIFSLRKYLLYTKQ